MIGQLILSRLPESEVKRRYTNFTDWKIFSERTPAACAALVFNQATHEVSAVPFGSCLLSTYFEETFRSEVTNNVIEYADKISKFVYL